MILPRQAWSRRRPFTTFILADVFFAQYLRQQDHAVKTICFSQSWRSTLSRRGEKIKKVLIGAGQTAGSDPGKPTLAASLQQGYNERTPSAVMGKIVMGCAGPNFAPSVKWLTACVVVPGAKQARDVRHESSPSSRRNNCGAKLSDGRLTNELSSCSKSSPKASSTDSGASIQLPSDCFQWNCRTSSVGLHSPPLFSLSGCFCKLFLGLLAGDPWSTSFFRNIAKSLMGLPESECFSPSFSEDQGSSRSSSNSRTDCLPICLMPPAQLLSPFRMTPSSSAR